MVIVIQGNERRWGGSWVYIDKLTIITPYHPVLVLDGNQGCFVRITDITIGVLHIFSVNVNGRAAMQPANLPDRKGYFRLRNDRVVYVYHCLKNIEWMEPVD